MTPPSPSPDSQETLCRFCEATLPCWKRSVLAPPPTATEIGAVEATSRALTTTTASSAAAAADDTTSGGAIADQRASLAPLPLELPLDDPSTWPTMSVNYGDRSIRLRVRPGPEGCEEFKSKVCACVCWP